MSCSGKPCSKVTYALESVDSTNLEYEYTPPAGGGATSTGTLTPGPGANDDYIAMWFGSFLLWLVPSFGFFGFPSPSPFRDVEPECGDGCECDLGPEVEKSKEYSYTDTFTLDSGAVIKISGKFKMKVTSQVGVCTLKAGTEYSMKVGKSQNLFASLISVNDGGLPVAITDDGKDEIA